MHSTLRPYVTAGAVIVGAGLITVAPMAAPVPHVNTVGDVALTAGPGADAFTIDGTTFDPFTGSGASATEGFNDFGPLVGLAPLLRIGTGSLALFGATPGANQGLEVYDSNGSDVGTVYTSVNASDLLGIDTAQFTVQSTPPPVADIQAALTGSDLDFTGANFTVSDLANALENTIIHYGTDIPSINVDLALAGAGISLSGTDITSADIAGVLNGIDVSALGLPDVGTVYSITNLGSGWANVYEAVPNAAGTAASKITDTLVTPFGNIDVPTGYDAVAHMDPGAAFAGFAATSVNSSLSADAFTIDGTTFDPGSTGFTSVSPLLGVAPLLEIGGGNLVFGSFVSPMATQDLEVYGASGTDLGSVTTSVNTQNLLGIDSAQLTVTAGTPAQGGDAADLPADGTVYSVTNLGSGYELLYIATPNADGTAAAHITDTFVTPNGNFDIPTTYDAIAPMDPGAPFAGLGVTSDASGLSDNAFTIDGTTFDPGTAGFTPVSATAGIAPLLETGGGTIANTPQDFDVYGSSGTEGGSIQTAVTTANIFGLIDTTRFSVDTYNDIPAADFVTALDNSDISFTGAGFTASDLFNALESSPFGLRFGNGDLSGSAITNALHYGGSGINLSAAGIDPDDVATVLNGEVDAYGAAAGLPDLGTVYSVTDFGGGFENVYEAVPNAAGTAASHITDTLVTPFGNVDLSTMFDAIAALDPGDAAAGVSTGAASGFDLFDPSTWF